VLGQDTSTGQKTSPPPRRGSSEPWKHLDSRLRGNDGPVSYPANKADQALVQIGRIRLDTIKEEGLSSGNRTHLVRRRDRAAAAMGECRTGCPLAVAPRETGRSDASAPAQYQKDFASGPGKAFPSETPPSRWRSRNRHRNDRSRRGFQYWRAEIIRLPRTEMTAALSKSSVPRRTGFFPAAAASWQPCEVSWAAAANRLHWPRRGDCATGSLAGKRENRGRVEPCAAGLVAGIHGRYGGGQRTAKGLPRCLTTMSSNESDKSCWQKNASLSFRILRKRESR